MSFEKETLKTHAEAQRKRATFCSKICATDAKIAKAKNNHFGDHHDAQRNKGEAVESKGDGDVVCVVEVMFIWIKM